MERIGIRELRDTLTVTLRRVRAGEAFEITHDGRPVALLTPIVPGRLARLVASGEVTPGTPLDRPLRPRPAATGLTASEALERDRADR
jgi:antitoxin (DNA-binding transcriptional repressor) of toxin-antitoxin stability system